ncbi:OmpA family protein [Paraburkholderia phymatum]|uniref:OmpA family protein n=1 Tax=Paraburkholderia phymatum TaxID=148447 RepID=UPI003176D9EF
MSGSIISFVDGRTARRALTMALSAIACVHVAHAADPVVKEQDIDEQSVTKALAPEDNGDNIVTRGFVLSNKQPGAAVKPAGPAKHPSLQMLITFTTNSSTLTDSAQAALDKVAHALQSEQLAAFRFRVEGHADPRGSADANMKLSEDRAAAVVDYLTHKDGIAPERLSSVGKGSTEPLNRRNPIAPENRRVTIITVTD